MVNSDQQKRSEIICFHYISLFWFSIITSVEKHYIITLIKIQGSVLSNNQKTSIIQIMKNIWLKGQLVWLLYTKKGNHGTCVTIEQVCFGFRFLQPLRCTILLPQSKTQSSDISNKKMTSIVQILPDLCRIFHKYSYVIEIITKQ